MGPKNRLFMLLLALTSFFLLYPTLALAKEAPDPNSFTAEGIVLMDATTGVVLYQKNESKQLYPASITKIMTAILALESGRLDDEVIVSERARYVDGSRIYLGEGEQKPLLDLVYGLMLNSGNDAAVAIAEHLAGSVEQFAELMNEKAKALGAVRTHFVNPHGLPDEAHVTTALDMAHIARYALQNDLFRQIVSTKTMPWQGEEWQSTLINTNEMLWKYDNMTGVKTGYTQAARQTYVGSAKRGETELIVVLLKVESRPQLWAEAEALLNYGFDRFETVKLHAQGDLVQEERFGQEHILQVEDDVYVTVDKTKPQDGQWSKRLEWLETGLPFIQDVWAAYYTIEQEGREPLKVPLRYRFSNSPQDQTDGYLAEQAGGERTIVSSRGQRAGVQVTAWGDGPEPEASATPEALHTASKKGGWVKRGLIILFSLLVLFAVLRRRRKKKRMNQWQGYTSPTSSNALKTKNRYSSKHWPPVI